MTPRPIASAAELRCRCARCGELTVYHGATLGAVRDMAQRDGWDRHARTCRRCAKVLKVEVGE